MKVSSDNDLRWLEGTWSEVAKAFARNFGVNVLLLIGLFAFLDFLVATVGGGSAPWIVPVNVIFLAGVAALYTVWEVPLKRLRHRPIKEKISLSTQVALMRKDEREKG